MLRYIWISVTFLDPLFHGKRDSDEAEWPPSPMRLFQALLAGARAGCRRLEWSESKAQAFRWLAGKQPPLMVAPEACLARSYSLYVPNNDSDEKPERTERLTTKTARPHHLLGGDTVNYLWLIDDTDWLAAEQNTDIICSEARHILALGWGIDQVVGNGRVVTERELSALFGRRWHPWKTHRPGSISWRVPCAGSLEDLDRVYQSFLRRVRGKQYFPELRPTCFETATYMRTEMLPQRSYACFELQEGIAFRQQDTVKVASMLRSLTCAAAKADSHEFPGGSELYVAGHLGKSKLHVPRFSYLPLPSIGHEHADGMIRRLLIAEPFGGNGSHADWAQKRLCNLVVRDKEQNERGVLLDPWRKSSRSMVRRYVDESRTWSTVTPLILPGFDDGKQAKAERLMMSAAQQAGIPVSAIAELTLRKAPFWPGSQHPRQYMVPNYMNGLPGWHALIVFREPIPGPLAMGAGRHAGLGLFAAMDN
jgi:CRISPR-associated protein Csb2